MPEALIANPATFARLLVFSHKVRRNVGFWLTLTSFTCSGSNAIELVDYGRESTNVNYAHTIQLFHRFLIDHLSSEGNTFPHNPLILKNASVRPDILSPAAAPVTQLLGIDAKNIITCMSCKAVREKENMTHIVDLTYPRKVYRLPLFSSLAYLSLTICSFRHL